jgi:hypothetical protein
VAVNTTYTCQLLPTTNYQLPTTNYQPPTTHRSYDPALTTTLVEPLPAGPVAWMTLTMITFVPVVE